MSNELICPDCGGVIGGDSEDPGRACTCWSGKNKITGLESKPASGGDTVTDEVVAAPTKVCCQCGKDLKGQKRLRDSRGYWCYACHKLDQEATKPKGVRCADCGRKVPESALAEVDGKKICGICRNDRKEAALQERRRSGANLSEHDRLAKQKLIWLVVIALALAAIIILRQLKIIGS